MKINCVIQLAIEKIVKYLRNIVIFNDAETILQYLRGN